MEKRFTLEYWVDDGWYVGRIKEIDIQYFIGRYWA